MRLVNLTKHTVVIHNETMGDQEIVLKSSGEARMDSKLVRLTQVVDDDTGLAIPIVAFEDDFAYGLPPARDGVILVVSKAVRAANPDRHDLASPDVTAQGAVVTCAGVRSVPGLVMNMRRQV